MEAGEEEGFGGQEVGWGKKQESARGKEQGEAKGGPDDDDETKKDENKQKKKEGAEGGRVEEVEHLFFCTDFKKTVEDL